MKLDLAKIVEARKRSRIDRARQLSDNIETQAHILKSIELYNLEAERLRIETALGQFGHHAPLNVAHAMAKTRLNFITKTTAQLAADTSDPYWRGQRGRKTKGAVDHGPLDLFMQQR